MGKLVAGKLCGQGNFRFAAGDRRGRGAEIEGAWCGRAEELAELVGKRRALVVEFSLGAQDGRAAGAQAVVGVGDFFVDV